MKKEILTSINEKFKNEINKNLEIEYSNEDYCEQDLEEYGIDDINDTAHYKIILFNESRTSAVILDEFYDLNDIRFGRNAIENFKYYNLDVMEIKKVIDKCVSLIKYS